jgi:hypothetical protein
VDSSATVDTTTESVQEIPENAQFVTFENGDTLWYALSEMTEGEFEEAHQKYNDKILRDTAAHPKINGRLELKTTAGKSFVSQDATGEDVGDSYSEYNYTGFLSPLNEYVIEHVLYEGMEHLLINRQTADTLILIAPPLLSPEKNLLAILFFDPYQSEEPYAVYTELYKVAAGKIHQTKRVSFDVTMPEYCSSGTYAWESKNIIAIKAELNGGKTVCKRVQLFW